MRLTLPEFQTKNDLFGYLVANKESLIAKKKSAPIISDSVIHTPSVAVCEKDFTSVKSEVVNKDMNLPEGVIRVKAVANSANFVDSHMDVLLPNAPAKSIKERKGMIPHLRDHIHETIAEVGDVVSIALEDLPVKQLGFKGSDQTTQCVVFTTDIRKDYSLSTYERYRLGKAKQHSIGLQYVKLLLCINSDEEDYKEEKQNFDKYYPQVINKDIIDQRGFFWVVPEYKLIENSVVLFGSNPYTPTIETQKSEDTEPPEGTQSQPPEGTEEKSDEVSDEELTKILNKLKKLENV